jgi:hypothetical protein
MTILRWLARIWTLLLLILIIFVALDPGPEGIRHLPLPEYIPLGMTALAQLGLLLAFRWERLGGIVALIGVAGMNLAYYLIHAELSGAHLNATLFWGVPAVVYLFCWSRGRPSL